VKTVIELLAQSSSTLVIGDDPATAVTMRPHELLDRGKELAARLRTDGVQPGERVAAQMKNTQTYLDLLAAAAVGRFVIMSVNTRFSDDLAGSLITRAGASQVIRSAEDLPGSRSENDVAELEPAQPEDRYVIFTTSGTTSAPKLVVQSQRSMAEHATQVVPSAGYDASTTMLLAMPLCGTFGLTSFMAALAGGATVVLPTVFDVHTNAQLIEAHQVTALNGSDDMFHRLLLHGTNLSSLTCAAYARFNSALDDVVDRMADVGVSLRGLYGMSEVQALFTMRRADEASDTRWHPGGTLSSVYAAYRVADGELQVQGPSLFEGYLADGGEHIDERLTAEHFDGPWFRTGDLAEPETPRSFRYLHRMGDALRIGGYLVAPAEIEAVLLEADNIGAAQVVAVDMANGARPVGFVILDDPSQPHDEDAVIAHAQSRLARFKSPVRVIVVEAFPVTDGPNGVKIQRSELRTLAAEALAQG